MARNIAFGSGNGNQEVDIIDIAALVLLPIASSLLFGVWTWEIQVFGGYDFLAPLWTIAGVDISMALLIIVGSVAWIALTNLANKKTDMDQYEFGAVCASIALPLLFIFVPAVESLVTWHDMMRLAAVLYVSAGAVYISYVG